MKKYYVGLIIIATITIGLTGFTVFQGLNTKQDNITEKRSREIATALNKYISKKRKIPASLSDVDIKDVPSTIKYEKISEQEYKFCTTYKQPSSYGFSDGITPLLYGGGVNRFGDQGITLDEYESSYSPSSLYPDYSHKKGENCQTVKPYNISSPSMYDYNYDSLDTESSGAPASIPIAARDTERQTDIKALHAQIESFYAKNGRYPTLINLNSVAFRGSDMKGLDTEALKDPVGGSAVLVSAPAKNYYSYVVKGSDGKICNNTTVDCETYTLTATLEQGGTFTRSNLI